MVVLLVDDGCQRTLFLEIVEAIFISSLKERQSYLLSLVDNRVCQAYRQSWVVSGTSLFGGSVFGVAGRCCGCHVFGRIPVC